jgi:hypothetical protein
VGYTKRNYRDIKNTFDIIGRTWENGFFSRTLTAANKEGIWISELTLNNNYIDIAFIEWCEINFIHIDPNIVTFSIKDGDAFLKSTNWYFKLFKKTFTYIEDGEFFLIIRTEMLTEDLLVYIINNNLTDIYVDNTTEKINDTWRELLSKGFDVCKNLRDLGIL